MWHAFIDAIMVYDSTILLAVNVFPVTAVPVPILAIRVQFNAYTDVLMQTVRNCIRCHSILSLFLLQWYTTVYIYMCSKHINLWKEENNWLMCKLCEFY